MEIPFYLFTGFLDSGKTKLIQETLEDRNFNKGEKTLILQCEEGEEEYNLDNIPGEVIIENIDRIEQINVTKFEALIKKYEPYRIMVEYNGMWTINQFYEALPDYCMVYQEIFLSDANQFCIYNQNMRNLVVDKLQSCEIVVLNRFNDSIDKMQVHKIVRSINRRANIAYETETSIEYDDIKDPLPYDITKDIVEINDEAYALFYQDLSEEIEKYDGKIVSFTGKVGRDKKLGDKGMVIGRHVMTCCEADITYKGIAATCDKPITAIHGNWYKIKAKIFIEKNTLYKSKGPVLHIIEITEGKCPNPEVATFY